MNHTFYKICLFFSGLILLSGLFQSYFYFQIGAQIYGLESFISWFLILNLLLILYTILLLKYFHHKKYLYSFSSLLLVAIASIAHAFVVYLILWSREPSAYLPITFLMLVGSGIFYGLSLIFSKAGNRPWLKIGGIFIFSIDLFLFSTYAWSLLYAGDLIQLEKYHEWAAIISNLVPVIYLMNFRSELSGMGSEKRVTKLQIIFNGLFGAAGVVFVFVILMFVSQISSTVNWFVQQPERAQKLAQPFEARTFVNGEGDTLKYRLMKPMDHNPQKKYPIVITLHGGAGSGSDNVVQVDGSWTAQLLAKTANRVKYPSFLFVPQCPPGSSWGVIENLPVVDSLVFEAIIALEDEFAIDKTRRYVMGESLGGYGSWHFISTQPEMFAAAVPICGGGNPYFADKIVDIPIWAFHGAQDRIVPVEGSRKMIAAIKEAGGNPNYTEFPDGGHIISERLKKN